MKKLYAQTYEFHLNFEGVPALLRARVFIDADQIIAVRALRLYDEETDRQIRCVEDGTLDLAVDMPPVNGTPQ